MSRRRRTAAYTAAAAAAMSDGPIGLGQRIVSVPGLVRDTLSGRYPGLGRGRLALMIAAVLYILSPVDLVPEALLSIPGLVDDAAVGAWLVAALMGATTGYRAWVDRRAGEGVHDHGVQDQGVPNSGSRVVPGEVVSP